MDETYMPEPDPRSGDVEPEGFDDWYAGRKVCRHCGEPIRLEYHGDPPYWYHPKGQRTWCRPPDGFTAPQTRAEPPETEAEKRFAYGDR